MGSSSSSMSRMRSPERSKKDMTSTLMGKPEHLTLVHGPIYRMVPCGVAGTIEAKDKKVKYAELTVDRELSGKPLGI